MIKKKEFAYFVCVGRNKSFFFFFTFKTTDCSFKHHETLSQNMKSFVFNLISLLFISVCVSEIRAQSERGEAAVLGFISLETHTHTHTH